LIFEERKKEERRKKKEERRKERKKKTEKERQADINKTTDSKIKHISQYISHRKDIRRKDRKTEDPTISGSFQCPGPALAMILSWLSP
jgi:hypothetical protein